MKTGRPKKTLRLAKEEYEQLRSLTASRSLPHGLVRRVRIVLMAADGLANRSIAEKLSLSGVTVGKWRSSFLERRLDGLTDEPRPGAPRKVSDDEVERVIAMTLESTPKGATHWSTRSMAQASKMSATTVRRIWHTFALQPHPVRLLKL